MINTLFEQNVCNYEIQGYYQLPCITTKEQNGLHIGVWANRHRQYLKKHHRIRYYNLLTSEKLYPYLADIEEQAQTIFSQLVKLLAKKENITP
ncbi:MAG: TnpV protein [Lachnospiraceae bacterium]|nr:TnpV protein [Lachnospiraceae bacterium]